MSTPSRNDQRLSRREREQNEHWLTILWPAARLLSKDGREREIWDVLTNVTKIAAERRAERTRGEELLSEVASLGVLLVLGAMICWIILQRSGPVSPHFFPPSTSPVQLGTALKCWGALLILLAMTFALLPVGLAILLPDWLLYFKISNRAAAFGLIIWVAFVGGGSVIGYMGELKLPSGTFSAAVVDGGFAGGVVVAAFVLAATISFLANVFFERRQMWHAPNAVLIEALLRSLNFTEPQLPKTAEPFLRLSGTISSNSKGVWDIQNLFREIAAELERAHTEEQTPPEGIWEGLEKWLRDGIHEQAITTDDIARLSKVFTWASTRTNLPHSVCAPLAAFLDTLETPAEQEPWPSKSVMGGLAYYLRNAAKCIRMLAWLLATGDPVRDKWLEQACNERAAYLLDLQRWVFLPQKETRGSLQVKLREFVELACDGDWGNMDRIDLSDIPRLPWWRRSLELGRTVLIGVLPLGLTLAALGSRTDPYDTLAKPLLPVALLWSAVYLLPLLDPRVAERVSSAKTFAGFWKQGGGEG